MDDMYFVFLTYHGSEPNLRISVQLDKKFPSSIMVCILIEFEYFNESSKLLILLNEADSSSNDENIFTHFCTSDQL